MPEISEELRNAFTIVELTKTSILADEQVSIFRSTLERVAAAADEGVVAPLLQAFDLMVTSAKCGGAAEQMAWLLSHTNVPEDLLCVMHRNDLPTPMGVTP